MNTWDRTRQDNKFKQKLQNVKSTLPKIMHSTSSNISSSSSGQKSRKSNNYYYSGNNNVYNNNYPTGNTTANSNNNGSPKKVSQTTVKAVYKRQNNFKFILREFGLSQYLRKLYEMGYDDHNYMKIGLMPQKKFEELMFNLKIFPGHQVKMVKLYDYLKSFHLHSFPNTPGANSNPIKKPNTSYGVSRYPLTGVQTPSQYNHIVFQDKPKAVSANTQRNYYPKNGNSHKIVNSFMNGDFGYNYYLNDNNNNNNIIHSHPDKKYNNYLNKDELSIETAKLEHIDSDDNYNKAMQGLQGNMNNNNEEIDKMLKYYMMQLNEKLDDSYDSVDDSSLSHINVTNDNIKLDKKDFETFGAKNNNLVPLGLPPTHKGKNINKQNEKIDVIDNITNNQSNTNNKRKKLPSIVNKKEDSNKKAKEEEQKTNPTKQEKQVEQHEQHEQQKTQEHKEEKIQKEDSIEQLIEEDEDIKKETKTEQHKDNPLPIKNEDISDKKNENENKQEQELHYSEPEDHDDIPEDVYEEVKDTNKNDIYPQRETEPNVGPRQMDINNPETEETIEQPQFSKEQDFYDTLRLNKSADGEYLRQNMEQFDIEYMCRCLGLAIMKHIEEAKDKQHITDLIDDSSKEAFSFFNSMYNSKMNFIFNFFNKDNIVPNISNLDRLDLELDKNGNQNKISYINHFQQKKDEELLKKSFPRTIPRLHSEIGDLERDIKFIDEIFGGGNAKKKKNYQFVSEKTKNILDKELSYINEVESEATISKLNNSINNTQKSGEVVNNNNTNKNNKQEDNIMVSGSLLKQSNEEKQEYYEDNWEVDEHEQAKEVTDNKFSSAGEINEISKQNPKQEEIKEEVVQPQDEEKETFPSGSMESNYVISASSISKIKSFLIKQSEVFDDDYIYSVQRIQSKKYVPPPDPQQIFEFCANIMCLTKMEKEVIIITLIYLERLMFNSGLLLTSRNWRRTIFTAMITASKIWDDDSFENNHFAQVFTHLSIGEINLLERTFLELIGYKVHVKCSEYFKYFFIVKSIALKYNYTGTNLVKISVERMMKIQEYAYQMQKRMKKRYTLNNSAEF